MVDWVSGIFGGSLIPRLHLTTLLRWLWLQTNLYCADSGSKWRNLLKMATAILRCIRFTFLQWKETEMRRFFLQSMAQTWENLNFPFLKHSWFLWRICYSTNFLLKLQNHPTSLQKHRPSVYKVNVQGGLNTLYKK